MRPSYFTPQNDELTHQVRFTLSGGQVQISCNCRMRPGEHHKAGKYHAHPMGVSKNIEESRELYNNPLNHWADFNEGNKAKW